MSVPPQLALAQLSRRPSLAVLAICWVVAQAPTLGCGPSFEAIQEGDLRFAHCDRLDLDPNISPSHRLHCWREWRRVYTYGQTRDRVEYAQRRIAEVVSGDTEPAYVLPKAGLGQAERRAQPPSGSIEVLPAAPLAPAAEPAPNAAEASPGCRSRCEDEHPGCAPGCATRATGCEPCRPLLDACLRECRVGAPEEAVRSSSP